MQYRNTESDHRRDACRAPVSTDQHAGLIVFGRFALKTPGIERVILGSPGRQRVVILGVVEAGGVELRSRVLIHRNTAPLVLEAIEAARAHDGGAPVDIGSIPLSRGGAITVFVRCAYGRPLIFFGRNAPDGTRIGRPSMIDGDEQVAALADAIAWATEYA